MQILGFKSILVPIMSKKILVFATSFQDTLASHPEGEEVPRRELERVAAENSLTLEFRTNRNPATPLSIDELKDAVAVIADLEVWPAPLLAQLGPAAGGDLRIIARYGIGYNNVDLEAAQQAGIIVTNTPAASARPTAEWAVATLLDIAGRRIPHHSRASRGLLKTGPSRLDVSGKTLGIVGTGTIGKYVQSMLSGFDLKLIVSDPYPDRTWAESVGAEYVELEELCSRADLITLHASGTAQIIGENELNRMKPETVLVNCARGILVDSRAVYKAVTEKRLFGYGLDEVWDQPDLPLTDDLNIAVSPHVGSDSDYGKLRMRSLSAEAVVRYLDGHEVPYVVSR